MHFWKSTYPRFPPPQTRARRTSNGMMIRCRVVEPSLHKRQRNQKNCFSCMLRIGTSQCQHLAKAGRQCQVHLAVDNETAMRCEWTDSGTAPFILMNSIPACHRPEHSACIQYRIHPPPLVVLLKRSANIFRRRYLTFSSPVNGFFAPSTTCP